MEKKEIQLALASALKQAVENIEKLRKAELAGEEKLRQKELKKAVAAPTMPGRGDSAPTAAHGTGDPANPGPLEILQHAEKSMTKNVLPGGSDMTNAGATVPGMMANAEKPEVCPECKEDAEKKKLCKKCSEKKLSKAYDTEPQMPMGWVSSTGKTPTRTVESVESKEPVSIMSGKVGNRLVGASLPAKEGQQAPQTQLFSPSALSGKFDPSGDVSSWLHGKPQSNPAASASMESGEAVKTYRGLQNPSSGPEGDKAKQALLTRDYNKETGKTGPSTLASIHARVKQNRTMTNEEWAGDRDRAGKNIALPFEEEDRLKGQKNLATKAKDISSDIREKRKDQKILAEKKSRELKLSEELININGTHQKDGSDKQERYETPNKQGEKAILPGDKDSKDAGGDDHKVRKGLPGAGKKVAKSAEKMEKVTPPGVSEETMHKLKDQYGHDEAGKEKAYATAWKISKEKKGLEKTTDQYANIKRGIGGDKNGSGAKPITASGKMSKQTMAPIPPIAPPPVPGEVGGLPVPPKVPGLK